ncbi:MAG: hypothetical protein CVV37_02215 [Nitrospira bacterium HGW-Nitrospira-1]|nr:MAG: hypothetical protein CVV37_02215 [Nitrospira bacterium HGW-Nitrospira-1]
MDATAVVSFKPLANLLKNKRTEINGDLRAFCKSNGFTQYKIKYIEESSVRNLDRDILAKYVRTINAEKEMKDWILKYPNVAKKYKIDTMIGDRSLKANRANLI